MDYIMNGFKQQQNKRKQKRNCNSEKRTERNEMKTERKWNDVNRHSSVNDPIVEQLFDEDET